MFRHTYLSASNGPPTRDLAPDFTLTSMLDGQVENLTLSSLQGQYIMLLFYPVGYGYVAPTLADLPCSVLAAWAIQQSLRSRFWP